MANTNFDNNLPMDINHTDFFGFLLSASFAAISLVGEFALRNISILLNIETVDVSVIIPIMHIAQILAALAAVYTCLHTINKRKKHGT